MLGSDKPRFKIMTCYRIRDLCFQASLLQLGVFVLSASPPGMEEKNLWDIYAEVPALQNGKTDLGAETTSAAQLISLCVSEEQAL